MTDPINIRCAEAIELVTDYLDEALSQRDLALFEAHIGDCEGCTAFIDQIEMTITLTSAVGDQQVEFMPANFDELLIALTAKDKRQ